MEQTAHQGNGARVNTARYATRARRLALGGILSLAVAGVCIPAMAQEAAPAPPPPPAVAQPGPLAVPPELVGRTVEEVRIIGRPRPLSPTVRSEVLHQVRIREGMPFDPATVEEDYRRIFEMRRFGNVEARVEPTATGVIVIFEITQQDQIQEIRFRGNRAMDTQTLLGVVGIGPDQAIDPFRLGMARESIQRLYRNRNYTHAHVEVDREMLNQGIVEFVVTEGPRVRIRSIEVLGNHSFTDERIVGQTRTRTWFPFFRQGRFETDQLEQDVAAIRQFYENNGFFDARVGRVVTVSPDQTEVMISYVIEEGVRYVVDRVVFRGNQSVSDEDLREGLRLTEGRFYDQDLVRRDIRQIVRVYSPLGFIYQPPDPMPDPDYLRIREQRVFSPEPGRVQLIYEIAEGRPFHLGRIIVRGNTRTQDKVILREMRVQPGQLYDSAGVQTSVDHIRATGLFDAVTVTPIGTDPEYRDLLVEVNETRTARFMIGAGYSTNSGVLGNITYEQRNFDIGNWPSTPSDLWTGRAFIGAGQTFRIQVEPGTELTRARVDFVEPYLFDQPYSLSLSAYLAQRQRAHWDENRAGGRVGLGRRFGEHWTARVSLRGENVNIASIRQPALRAPEVLLLRGHSTLVTAGLDIRHDTTDSPIFPTSGTVTSFGVETSRLLGDFDFDKFSLGLNHYLTLHEDLLERKTVLSLRADAGYITGDAPFFERFYGGGIGSVRGFRFRGISPRSGIDLDPIGGDFMLTGSAEVIFPLVGETLRGVIFVDAGTVERDFEIGTIRTSAGFGFRIMLPILGQVPLALDFGFPITRRDEDDRQIFSFSMGFVQ